MVKKNVKKEKYNGSNKLSVLLSLAMFVLVVDTSLMNVSLSSVVNELDTTVSTIQSAIALEALVSAAFILISSKVGDIIKRKRAYILGLLGYGLGAITMTLTSNVTSIFIFWAIIGGLGASLLLPAMQSLIHGNFSGTSQKKNLCHGWCRCCDCCRCRPTFGRVFDDLLFLEDGVPT